MRGMAEDPDYDSADARAAAGDDDAEMAAADSAGDSDEEEDGEEASDSPRTQMIKANIDLVRRRRGG